MSRLIYNCQRGRRCCCKTPPHTFYSHSAEMAVFREVPFAKSLAKRLKPSARSDNWQRINYIGSVMVVAASCAIIAAFQPFGPDLTCWVPSQFSMPWEGYTEHMCMLSPLLVVNEVSDIQNMKMNNETIKEIGYYPYLPLLIAASGLIFVAVHRLSELIHGGNTHQKVLDNSSSIFKIVNHKDKAEQLVYFAYTLKNTDLPALGSFFYATRVLIQLTYIMACALVMGMIHYIIDDDWLSPWPLKSLYEVAIKGRERSILFPLEAYCTISVPALGVLHTYDFKCGLLMMSFYEILIVTLWLFYGFLLLLNIWYTVSCVIFYLPFVQRRAIKNILGKSLAEDTVAITKFRSFLGVDGVYLLTEIRRVADNLAGEVADILLLEFLKNPADKDKSLEA